jgi:hypothetical protein
LLGDRCGDLFLISLKIISYGFMPGGAMRRHVAKAFTEKHYTEIVVLRPGYTVDHSPGWEWLLRSLHQKINWGADALVSFSIISMLVVVCMPAALIAPPGGLAGRFIGANAGRAGTDDPAGTGTALSFDRRYSHCRTLFLDKKPAGKTVLEQTYPDRSGNSRLGLDAWVLVFVGPADRRLFPGTLVAGGRRVDGLLDCRRLRRGAVNRPARGFLTTNLLMASDVIREGVPQWILVGEFQPSEGEFTTLVLLTIVFLWRKDTNKDFLRWPLIWMIAIGWILGLRADRSWADWGIPAVLVWLAIQFEEIMKGWWSEVSFKRIAIAGLVAVPLLFQSTNDLGRRYTHNLEDTFLDASDSSLQGWLPEENGIFYSADMGFFYNTFFKIHRRAGVIASGLNPH